MSQQNPLDPRAARIDIDGRLLLDGTVGFPPDDAGLFPCPRHVQVLVDRGDPGMIARWGMTVSAADGARDPKTGFMRANLLGPVVTLPAVLSTLIRDTLRSAADVERVTAAVSDVGGWLRSSPDARSAKRQALDRWTLSFRPDGEGVIVRLTAVLCDPRPPSPFDPDEDGDFWTRHEPPAELAVTFTVDGTTRALAFGWAGGVQRLPAKPVRLSTGPDDISLAGAVRPIHAVDSDGVVTLIRQGAPNDLSLWLERRGMGVFDHEDAPDLPTGSRTHRRFWISGVSMATLAAMLRDMRRTRTALSGERVGVAEIPGDAGGTLRIVEAVFDLELERRGLRLDYRFVLERLGGPDGSATRETAEGGGVISWETVIIHFPGLLRHRSALAG